MKRWSEFHSDPRISYYLSLRRDYLCSASQAHDKVKRFDRLVVGIRLDRYSALQRLVSALRWSVASLGRWGAQMIHRKPAAH